jgi:isopentenyl diphosphate isomerase/L-lactate dehydrogenase-like FMN-dependent dehydrogenase
MNYDNILNMDDLERAARRRVPRAVFDAVAGGSDDEITVRENRRAYRDIWLRQKAFADVRTVDASTTVLGERVSMPLLLAPTGMARMADSSAESGVARAAVKAGTIFAVSSAASQPLEQIAAAAQGPLWYQLYYADRDSASAMIDRVEAAGYSALCLTIDSAVLSKRERDARNRFTIPLRMTPKLLMTGVSKPRWTKDFLLGKTGRVSQGGSGMFAARAAYRNLATVLTHSKLVTWDDLAWLRERWPGKLVIKGVMRGDECPRMIDMGVDGIVVSNHGGRQLDGSPSTISVVPEVVQAVDGRAEVYVDGGIRRGTDVLKALALGAQACFIGRPYIWGLAADGETGVSFVMSFFQSEIERGMALLGTPTIADIDRSAIGMEARPAVGVLA